MTSLPRLLVVAALLLACGDDGADPTTSTTDPPATSTGVDPTTGGGTSTGPEPTTDGTSSTGEPVVDCFGFADEAACTADPACEWKPLVQYVHSGQGCVGNLVPYCVQRDGEGALSSWYLDQDGDTQVLQFEFTPTDLGPEWKPCGCDGPLACLCAFGAPDCPERIPEFCETVTNAASCAQGTLINNEVRCAWFSVSPEGPKDDQCTGDAQKGTCLEALNGAASTCDDAPLDYPQCQTWTDPVFWREQGGVVEVTTLCGPEPVGWTKCEPVDTPDQPDECGCRCL
jgi:hypothetical protein